MRLFVAQEVVVLLFQHLIVWVALGVVGDQQEEVSFYVADSGFVDLGLLL